MSNAERLYKIDALIRHRGTVSFAALQEALEVSRATLKRDLAYLRDRLGAPIVHDRMAGGYRMAAPDGAHAAPRHELPGLWFDERELYALLMAHQLLTGLDDDGLLARHLTPLLDRIHHLLGPDGEQGAGALMQRVRIVAAQRRGVAPRAFEIVGQALTQRRRLRMTYVTRGRGEVGERDVSPQRLVHYRSTWYLDAWCHRRDGLLRFALDAIEAARLLDAPARDVPLEDVRAAMDRGYGIYAGGTPREAVLRFSPSASRWVRHEVWHEAQRGELLPDGRWQLSLPYVDDTELVMDLLRQGPDVKVVSPPALRARVAMRLRDAAAVYANADEAAPLLQPGHAADAGPAIRDAEPATRRRGTVRAPAAPVDADRGRLLRDAPAVTTPAAPAARRRS